MSDVSGESAAEASTSHRPAGMDAASAGFAVGAGRGGASASSSVLLAGSAFEVQGSAASDGGSTSGEGALDSDGLDGSAVPAAAGIGSSPGGLGSASAAHADWAGAPSTAAPTSGVRGPAAGDEGAGPTGAPVSTPEAPLSKAGRAAGVTSASASASGPDGNAAFKSGWRQIWVSSASRCRGSSAGKVGGPGTGTGPSFGPGLEVRSRTWVGIRGGGGSGSSLWTPRGRGGPSSMGSCGSSAGPSPGLGGGGCIGSSLRSRFRSIRSVESGPFSSSEGRLGEAQEGEDARSPKRLGPSPRPPPKGGARLVEPSDPLPVDEPPTDGRSVLGGPIRRERGVGASDPSPWRSTRRSTTERDPSSSSLKRSAMPGRSSERTETTTPSPCNAG